MFAEQRIGITPAAGSRQVGRLNTDFFISPQ